MKIFNILIILLFISFACIGQDIKNNTEIFSVKNLQKDFTVFRNHIERINPITYLYNSKLETKTYLDSIELLINKPMTELEFYRKISPISSFTKDGHNLLIPSKETNTFLDQHPYNLPLKIILINNELILVENYDEKVELNPKFKITSINNISSISILDRLYKTLPIEGNQSQLATYIINKWFRYFYHLHFGFTEKYNIEYIDFSNKKMKTIVDGKTLDYIVAKRKLSNKQKKEKGVYVELIEELPNTALLNVPTFSDLFLKQNFKQKNFKKIIDNCFDTIFNNNTQYLIIDIRENGGGNPEYAKHILKYLFNKPFTQAIEARFVTKPKKEGFIERTSKRWIPWYGIGTFKPKKNNYKGEIFVLTSGGSFSAAIEFATTLKKYNRATFIGEETGGNPIIMSGTYFKVNRQLPKTKMDYHSGTLCTIYQDLKLNTGSGIIPDYPIIQTIEDRFSEKDLFLEKAISIIKSKGK